MAVKNVIHLFSLQMFMFENKLNKLMLVITYVF